MGEFWVYSLDSTFSCCGNGLLGVSRLFAGKSDFLKNRLIRSFLMVLYFTYFYFDFLSVNVNVHIIISRFYKCLFVSNFLISAYVE